MLNNEGMSDALSKNLLVTEGGGQKKKDERDERTNEVMVLCVWGETKSIRIAGLMYKEESFHHEENYS